MQFEGAVITEQGVTFGIIVVKQHVLSCPSAQDEMRRFGLGAFGPMPIVLMAQDSHGTPTYQGRTDIVKFLANIFVEQIPWQQYTLSAA